MTTRNLILLCVVAPVITGALGGLIAYNLTVNTTAQHTSTISGTSGELKCSSSCVVKND